MNMTRTHITCLTIVAAVLAIAPAAAQNASVAGVWRAREGTPTGLARGVTSSDVQTMYLTADGQYRREIISEGGNGVTTAAGKIIDTGTYRFTAPATFQYSRRSWIVCVPGACKPGMAPPPNAGSLPFHLDGRGHAQFIGLMWTKLR
ncbi:MAG: hypothetical protein ACLPYS_00880 [Vulcanimicrobiaceae bacterium]